MKKFLLITLVMLLGIFSRAQTFTANFTGAAAAIPNGATTQKCFPVTVTGVGNINGTTIGLAQVCLNITHPDVGDIEIVLRAPDGTVVPLSVQNGGAGNNYTGTCFTATATNPIKSGAPPYTGIFKPEGHLGAVNNGQNANGTWSVCVQDRRNPGSTGTLTSFSLTFSNTPAPAAPSQPPCTTTLPTTSTCANATSICDFSGVCGTTNGNTIQDWTNSGLGSCFGIENNSFIKFIASATTASFSIWVRNSSFGGNYYTGGIQMEFFSGTCGSGPVTSYGCYPHIYPSTVAQPIISVVTASGLTIGNTYYLMIDGFGGDHCEFTIEANSGVNVLNITPPVASVCPGGSTVLTATGGNGVYSWSPSATLSSSTGSTVTASPTIATIYTVTSVTAGGCPLTKDVTVNITPPPTFSLQPSLAPQNVCPGQNATALTVTAAAGSGTVSGYQWYVNTTASNTGGTLIPGATSATYTPPNTPSGTFYYYCVVTNSNSCATSSNVSGAVNILTPLAPPTASVTVQATCSTGGTITVSSPLGANFTYSIDGTNYQASPVFPNLTPASYNVTVRNITTGCTSAATVVVMNPPATLAPPTASVTVQATCSTGGTITVSSPLGVNFTYSIDGTNYQASPVFPNLPPTSYNVTVRNITTGCTSAATVVVVNPPATLAPPTASVTVQATCSTGGTITVSSPLGANFTYSIDGTNYQASPVFPNLPPTSYNVTVRNITTGCTSAATPIVVNPPATLAPPTASVTVQATCSTGGTITVSSPLGANFTYSIDGTNYQASPVFPNQPPNSYNITVRNIVTGCTSAATVVVVANPSTLAPPMASVTVQATCATGGTITVSSPLGANYTYGINGNYQASPVFPNQLPNSYNITVRDIATGCTSNAAVVVVNAPSTPAAPAVSVTQPTCVAGGMITISSPLGANYTYSINGTTYQASPVFPTLAATTYNVTVRDINTGCTSSSTPVVLTTPATVPAPTLTVSQPTCIMNTGTITVTAPIGPDYEYRIDGLTYQASPTFSGVAPGPHTINVRHIPTGCTSANTPVTIVPAATLAAPVASATLQPTCTTGGNITVSSPLGAQYEYSIDGVNYQPALVFTGLNPGTYNVTVRDNTSGCVSSAAIVTMANPPGGPAAPTATTTQPTCTVITGTITVTSPLGANLEYSIDGTTYQAATLFSSVAPGTYNLTVKNTVSGCISAPTPVTINTLPAVPTAPVASVTQQATCATPTGTITITSPIGPNIQYSIDGVNYQSGLVFAGLTPNTYNVTAKNTVSGCVSTITQVTVNPPPNAPATPAASVTQQTTCAVQGIITIASPVGTDYQYSINGTTYQTSPVFNNVVPGNYNVTVKSVSTGCISASVPLIVNPVPAAPVAPTASATKQPSCADKTGTITITAPLGSSLEYSVNGTTWQASPVFSGLAPATTYSVRVRDVATSCQSAVTTVQITAVPGQPAAPTVNTSPRCGPGIANMSAAGTGTITWYSDAGLTNAVATGITYAPVLNASTIFYVKATLNGCSSVATPVTAEVSRLPQPSLGANRTICKGEALVLNPGTFTKYLWQDNSTRPTFTANTAATNTTTYSVQVENNDGCKGTASVQITVVDECDDIYFPNAFTPNGDSKNDEFGPLPPNSFVFVTDYNLMIFNRYGQRVFQSNTPAKKWSGKYLGVLTPGNYVWYATYKFKGKVKTQKGNILVIK